MRGSGGVAIDATGRVFTAGFDNDVIRIVATDGIITTIAGTGERLG